MTSRVRFSYTDRVLYKDVIDWLISHFDVPINDFDFIIGYRADDSYFSYSRGFVNGDISIETLSNALKLGKLGKQYVLISKKAFNNIKYVKHYEVHNDDEYELFRQKTLNEYHELLNKEDRFVNHFIGDLMKKYGK